MKAEAKVLTDLSRVQDLDLEQFDFIEFAGPNHARIHVYPQKDGLLVRTDFNGPATVEHVAANTFVIKWRG